MAVGAMIQSEMVKMRHSIIGLLHIFMPVLGAVVFLSYFAMYPEKDSLWKCNFFAEVTASLFPILISIIVAINISYEETPSHFYAILAVSDRKKILLGKLISLYVLGIIAFAGLCIVVGAGMLALGAEKRIIVLLFKIYLGMAVTILFSYILHLFCNLKSGMGISLTIGILESMQCILYSNISLPKMFWFNPFAWTIEWIQQVMQKQFFLDAAIQVFLILTIALFAVLNWFLHWEGRKGYE